MEALIGITMERLIREEWDFSSVPVEDVVPALLWETNRESADIPGIVDEARAWLAGKLSTKKPPMPVNRRTGKRPEYNYNFSEAELARLKTMSVFSRFIPFGKYHHPHNLSMKQNWAKYEQWLRPYLEPLLENYELPWVRLTPEERQRLRNIFESERDGHVVAVTNWWEAIAHFRKHKPDAGLPLRFDYAENTVVLININWSFSKKRLLTAMGNLLDQIRPPTINEMSRWEPRGRKHRDKLVMLERLAMMRLLHHYTLSELKRLLPDAWNHYQNRKWYDERRRALEDFRMVVGYADKEHFPNSWSTRAHRSRRGEQLPGK